MGMFDYIRCDYPLPGTTPSFIRDGHLFQSKDLDCVGATYTISEEGIIDVEHFYGTVNFYDSNICGSGPGVYTRNGEDTESVEYVAVFIDSKLESLTQISYVVGPGMKMKAFVFDEATPEEKEEWRKERERRENTSLLGEKLFIQYGGMSPLKPGEYAEVVAEGRIERVLNMTMADWH